LVEITFQFISVLAIEDEGLFLHLLADEIEEILQAVVGL
jgi:hypothetical protein